MTNLADTSDTVMTVGVHEAKTHLSRLLRLVDAGQEVAIRRNGQVVARLVPPPRRPRRLGLDEGLLTVPDDFDAPLPDDVVDSFYA